MSSPPPPQKYLSYTLMLLLSSVPGFATLLRPNAIIAVLIRLFITNYVFFSAVC